MSIEIEEMLKCFKLFSNYAKSWLEAICLKTNHLHEKTNVHNQGIDINQINSEINLIGIFYISTQDILIE